MPKVRLPVIGSILALAGATAEAQTTGPMTQACATPAAFGAQIEEINRSLGAAMLHVESVPPRDADFLERETKAAFQLGDRRRFAAAYANAYYRAFQVHSAHASVLQNLRLAQQQKTVQSRGLLLVKALSEYAEFAERMSDYISNRSRDDGGERVRSLAFDVARVRYQVANALSCDLRLMKEP
jgi:hypothetical protein